MEKKRKMASFKLPKQTTIIDYQRKRKSLAKDLKGESSGQTRVEIAHSPPKPIKTYQEQRKVESDCIPIEVEDSGQEVKQVCLDEPSATNSPVLLNEIVQETQHSPVLLNIMESFEMDPFTKEIYQRYQLDHIIDVWPKYTRNVNRYVVYRMHKGRQVWLESVPLDKSLRREGGYAQYIPQGIALPCDYSDQLIDNRVSDDDVPKEILSQESIELDGQNVNRTVHIPDSPKISPTQETEELVIAPEEYGCPTDSDAETIDLTVHEHGQESFVIPNKNTTLFSPNLVQKGQHSPQSTILRTAGDFHALKESSYQRNASPVDYTALFSSPMKFRDREKKNYPMVTDFEEYSLPNISSLKTRVDYVGDYNALKESRYQGNASPVDYTALFSSPMKFKDREKENFPIESERPSYLDEMRDHHSKKDPVSAMLDDLFDEDFDHHPVDEINDQCDEIIPIDDEDHSHPQYNLTRFQDTGLFDSVKRSQPTSPIIVDDEPMKTRTRIRKAILGDRSNLLSSSQEVFAGYGIGPNALSKLSSKVSEVSEESNDSDHSESFLNLKKAKETGQINGLENYFNQFDAQPVKKRTKASAKPKSAPKQKKAWRGRGGYGRRKKQ